ncbi:Nuclear pore complex protein [Nymphaea thermarum]|nr:Nuclear pore complex protein [Nymphaea thermarum]
MECEMEDDLPEFDPHDLRVRERKRQAFSGISQHEDNSNSKSAEARLFFNGLDIQRRPNAALFLEEIKQEIENYEVDDIETTPGRVMSSSRRRLPADGQSLSELDDGYRSVNLLATPSTKPYKHEDDASADTGGTTFTLFASLLESALQGLISFPDLILQFENTCRNMSETIRDEATGRHRIVEDKLMRQKSKLLNDEAATWSLLWYLFGKGNEEIPESLILSPSTSHQEACLFVMDDHTAQLCLRIVQWLEGLASKALDLEKKIRGWHVGSYLHNSGLWQRTQRFLKKGVCDSTLVQHLDFDAPTREDAFLLSEDKKQEDSLLEDIWILLRAGRLEEACELCRSAGQPWRAGTLCPFGGLDQFPSVEALNRNGKNRALQATELESGIGFQRRLWKWACFCASEKVAEQEGGKFEAAVFAIQCSNVKRVLPVCKDWESACWVMTKSWLDSQIDLELARLLQSKSGQTKSNEDSFCGVSRQGDQSMNVYVGTETWPSQVLDQQPHDLRALLQKLHSGEMVHEAVSRDCRDQHRQIQMDLMLGDVTHLLDLLKFWITPSEDDNDMVFRPCGDPQLVRFGAHLVLVLRYLLADDMKDAFKEKLVIVGNFILYMYAVYLFSQNHEELVGVYASQLAPHLCVDLFVHMMEIRLMASVHVKYRIFRSAMEYLPFLATDASKGCFGDILERVLSRSREIICNKSGGNSHNAMEQHQLQTIRKAMVVQWLCFTPPSTINGCEEIKAKLLKLALTHSNMLFREFALISMRRTPELPAGAHMLLSFLAEPLQQPIDTLFMEEEDDISEDMVEFKDWVGIS